MDIDNRFSHHPPKDEATIARHQLVRQILGDTAKNIILITETGREQSLAVTHLEEAMFWANASIARQ